MTAYWCPLCGREGRRGFVLAPAAQIPLPERERRLLRLEPTDTVTICKAKKACDQRRRLGT